MSKRTCQLASGIIVISLAVGVGLHPAQARNQPTLMAISFANRHAGWVSGHTLRQAFIFHTSNEGRSWTRRTVGFDAQQMQFINDRDGWAIGFMPPRCGTGSCRWVIEATHDGGRTWRIQLAPGPCWHLSSLDFVTPLEGWALETNDLCGGPPRTPLKTRIIGTTDGGGSWHIVFATRLRVTAVHVGSPLEGWAVVDALGRKHARCRTVLFHTSDGGRSWGRQFALRGYCAGWVDFVDSFHGWMLVTNTEACSMGGCYDNRLYRSTDGGRHWTVGQQVTQIGKAAWSGPSGFLGLPHFVTPSVGYIPVAEGAGPGIGGVDITHDGGLHWVREEPYGLAVGDISPIEAQTTWAIGCQQPSANCTVLLHTANAGRSWTHQVVS